MLSRRESLQEALRAWRTAERERQADGDSPQREASVVRLRDEYQRVYSANMTDNLSRLHEAEDRRSHATPSTPDFHLATQDTEVAAADIWEQARRADRDTPNGEGDKR